MADFQSSGRTRSSSVVTLARPSVSSSLQITNRCFRYASPHLNSSIVSYRMIDSVMPSCCSRMTAPMELATRYRSTTPDTIVDTIVLESA